MTMPAINLAQHINIPSDCDFNEYISVRMDGFITAAIRN